MPEKSEENIEFVGLKMKKGLVSIMDEYIGIDTHTNRSEFIRAAIREKIQRDMPDLWMKFLSDPNFTEKDTEVEVTT